MYLYDIVPSPFNAVPETFCHLDGYQALKCQLYE